MPPLVLQLPRLGVAALGGALTPDWPPALLPSARGEHRVAWRPSRSPPGRPAVAMAALRCGPQSFGPRGQPLPAQQLAGVGAPSLCWSAGLEGVA